MIRRHIAVLLAGAFLLAPVAPLTAQNTVRSISATDKAQGTQVHPQLLAQFGRAYKGPQATFVERVGKRVAVQSGLSNAGSDFTVTLLDSPVENAFAIPGGYIYVTRQLLALMTSEAELASVMGHEVGHVAARHAASRNTRATIGGLLARGVSLATKSDLATRIAGTGAQLYTLKYGRDQEYQADALGVRYITAAGYSPYASAGILAALDESTGLTAQASGTTRSAPTWASTHPNGADRVQRAAALAKATGKAELATTQDTAFLRMLDGLPYADGKEGRKVIRIVTVGARDTIDTLSQRMAVADSKRERFIVINGLPADEPLKPGTLVKLVVAA
ncbi:M48 family metalloprotease [Sphingomonas sp. CFBP 13733]|uniref:M48 family metalloprotease n=1 Tax=Sphingomonas sp. CFBP 13733 TaxID=2775291 RepID=UPI00178772BA|nr:M48 family metalloprotease [Sphingomonas sp. CFBP 13733]MBD8641835.1 M48 family metalloprotease [Sphingomonas sp. CFBP 13733]